MANSGDNVKIITKDEEFEGILMPRPDILYKDITVVKLGSGYNIGIENKKIKEIKLIKKYTPKKEIKSKIKIKKGLPNVTILSTGGTISSKIDYRTGGVVADYTAEDFINMIPELASIANIKAKKIMSGMSEDFDNKDWSLIAKEVSKELNSKEVDGVVVTMGTDTLHIISKALSFFIKDINKPIVITGSQRSIDRGSSDAFMNLLCSVIAAVKFDGAEVMTCLHATTNDDYCILNKGSKVRKMHTSRRDAFRPINELPLAKIYEDTKIDIINKNYKKRNQCSTSVNDKFEEKTALIHIYPGIDLEIIDFYVKKGFKGIVLAATALGHVPQKLYPSIEKAIKANVPIIIASQTLYGRVHPLVYSALRMLSIKLKCIFVEDMLPETAYVKLGWVLGQTNNQQKIKELMLTNIAGEITDRSDEKSFLY
jgi:glutamyl-tRNA(Gln) amidotransferase subunit D